MSLDHARTVADAVLYEGYLLYPYRATSSKNQTRWQWGVLGPPGASAAGFGEESVISTQCLLRNRDDGQISVHLRFLQLQTRNVERVDPSDGTRFEPVSELRVGTRAWMSWDEAVPHELEFGPCSLAELEAGRTFDVVVAGDEDVEMLADEDGSGVGRLVRRRWPLTAVLHASVTPVDTTAGDVVRFSAVVENTSEPIGDSAAPDRARSGKDEAVRLSFIGTHLLLAAHGSEFVSLLEPPDEAGEAAAACRQRRCWPVLAGEPGRTDVVLASPIILYDYPEVAEQSAGALFDSTEIDEILTLRVMTLTDEEKADARATDPRAAEIIDRCDAMSPESMQALHGILRDPHAGVDATSLDEFGSLDELLDANPPDASLPDASLPDMDSVPTFTEVPTYTDVRNADPPSFDTGGNPWWDPASDAGVRPDADTVLINGVLVAKDSLVRLHPSRRADAQDLFFAGQEARVTAVLCDVDGQVHVAVVLVDDPAAEMHEWYGRYMYFAPEELEPLDDQSSGTTSDHREESRS